MRMWKMKSPKIFEWNENVDELEKSYYHRTEFVGYISVSFEFRHDAVIKSPQIPEWFFDYLQGCNAVVWYKENPRGIRRFSRNNALIN